VTAAENHERNQRVLQALKCEIGVGKRYRLEERSFPEWGRREELTPSPCWKPRGKFSELQLADAHTET
jgi:hypothetical protein